MASRKVLTAAEHAELLGLFQQATVGDGNVWKVFSELTKQENQLSNFHIFSILFSQQKKKISSSPTQRIVLRTLIG